METAGVIARLVRQMCQILFFNWKRDYKKKLGFFPPIWYNYSSVSQLTLQLQIKKICFAKNFKWLCKSLPSVALFNCRDKTTIICHCSKITSDRWFMGPWMFFAQSRALLLAFAPIPNANSNTKPLPSLRCSLFMSNTNPLIPDTISLCMRPSAYSVTSPGKGYY